MRCGLGEVDPFDVPVIPEKGLFFAWLDGRCAPSGRSAEAHHGKVGWIGVEAPHDKHRTRSGKRRECLGDPWTHRGWEVVNRATVEQEVEWARDVGARKGEEVGDNELRDSVTSHGPCRRSSLADRNG